jgi:lysozyme
MNDNMHLSPAGANLIKHFEGCLKPHGDKFRAYRCPANVLTIGWGTTNEGHNKFDSDTIWTREQCDKAFLVDMIAFENEVKRLVKVQLLQYQFDALTSFTYNCGSGNLAKSTLLKKVNAKDFDGAAAEFKKWDKGGGRVLAGLVRRRACEALLFRGVPDLNYDGKPDKVIAAPHEPMPQQVDAAE